MASTSRDPRDTRDDATGDRARPAPRPGVAVIFDGGPVCRPVALEGPLVVGRDAGRGLALQDDSVSRQHAEVAFDGARWTVRDLGSRNGTFLDGERVERPASAQAPRVLRAGQTLLLLVPDVARLQARVVVEDGVVAGPALQEARGAIARHAAEGRHLLLSAESGTGKELGARLFHQRSPRSRGPLVPINCAGIPATVAERLLFGAVRGAYSDARADVRGYFQEASGGVLFLDEVGELELPVQAKLLRVLETLEVLPLGASRSEPVDVQVVFATHRDLLAAVGAGTFREDLYYRIADPQVRLPPLRERPEEIPWLIAAELRRCAPGLTLRSRLVEDCLLRTWRGNVRELLAAVRSAASAAQAAGEELLTGAHLAPEPGAAATAPPTPAPPADLKSMDRADLERVLAESGGNVSAAARALGVHRTQLYRAIKAHGIRAEPE
jgi:transcriptional regulator with GAF, ATPase, and Fis domain